MRRVVVLESGAARSPRTRGILGAVLLQPSSLRKHHRRTRPLPQLVHPAQGQKDHGPRRRGHRGPRPPQRLTPPPRPPPYLHPLAACTPQWLPHRLTYSRGRPVPQPTTPDEHRTRSNSPLPTARVGPRRRHRASRHPSSSLRPTPPPSPSSPSPRPPLAPTSGPGRSPSTPRAPPTPPSPPSAHLLKSSSTSCPSGPTKPPRAPATANASTHDTATTAWKPRSSSSYSSTGGTPLSPLLSRINSSNKKDVQKAISTASLLNAGWGVQRLRVRPSPLAVRKLLQRKG